MTFTEHPIHEIPVLEGKDSAGRVVARFRDGRRLMTVEQLTEFHRLRETQIANEKEDPLRYEWEPAAWHKADAILDEHRELLILGGNRSGKSSYAAKRMMRLLMNKPNARVWCFQETAANSVEMQQPLLWKYMPPELRNARKSRVTNISYGQKTGFAENSFVLPNGSQCFFRNYSQDVSTIEGGEIDAAWVDELVPLNFLETLIYRLMTRRGELLGTFTPIEGYSATVRQYLQGAVTEELREAALLPIYGKRGGGSGSVLPGAVSQTRLSGESGLVTENSDRLKTENSDRVVIGYERLPIVQRPVSRKGRVLYFWSEDNPFGGYEQIREELVTAKREVILVRAYGVPTKAMANAFPRFSEKVHVLPEDRLPAKGTDYHVVDPCSGRNWAMVWARFDTAGRCFIMDEWPREDRYIEGIGFPGKWAEPDGKRHDGRPGEAQKAFGFGLVEYKAEIAAVEVGSGQLAVGSQKKFEVFERIMDSRYGNAQTVAREGATTLIEECAELGLDFLAAPGDAISEGIGLINDWLAYDTTKPVSATNQPRLYVNEKCTNTIYALQEWTGRDGKSGACKDFVDVLRYLLLSGAGPVESKDLAVSPRGAY